MPADVGWVDWSRKPRLCTPGYSLALGCTDGGQGYGGGAYGSGDTPRPPDLVAGLALCLCLVAAFRAPPGALRTVGALLTFAHLRTFLVGNMQRDGVRRGGLRLHNSEARGDGEELQFDVDVLLGERDSRIRQWHRIWEVCTGPLEGNDFSRWRDFVPIFVTLANSMKSFIQSHNYEFTQGQQLLGSVPIKYLTSPACG